MPGDVPGMGGICIPADPDYGDSVSVAGTLGSKSDFDRRKKKRYSPIKIISGIFETIILLRNCHFLNIVLTLKRGMISPHCAMYL